MISSTVLDLLDQPQIYWQFKLIWLSDFLTYLALLRLLHFIYQRLLTGLNMPVLFTNLNLMKFWVRLSTLFFSLLSYRKLIVVLDWQCLQECYVNARSFMVPLVDPLFVWYTLIFLMLYVNILIYAGDTFLNFKYDWAFNLWQQLEVVSALESNL